MFNQPQISLMEDTKQQTSIEGQACFMLRVTVTQEVNKTVLKLMWEKRNDYVRSGITGLGLSLRGSVQRDLYCRKSKKLFKQLSSKELRCSHVIKAYKGQANSSLFSPWKYIRKYIYRSKSLQVTNILFVFRTFNFRVITKVRTEYERSMIPLAFL